MKEVWKDIPELKGYETSNTGNVRSKDRLVLNKRTNKFHSLKGKEIKKFKNKQGYYRATLSIDGIAKTYLVHKIVWEAFNGPISDGMEINHINEDKTDNRIENLELVTHKENLNWGTRNERVKEKQKNNKTKSKCVLQYSLDGCLVKEWPSLMEIERQLGYNHTCISSCCLNKYEKMYGYMWKYKEGE